MRMNIPSSRTRHTPPPGISRDQAQAIERLLDEALGLLSDGRADKARWIITQARDVLAHLRTNAPRKYWILDQ